MTDARPLALVTGASSGIGLELVKLIAADGYDVAIAADRPLDGTREAIKAAGSSVPLALEIDLSRPESVSQLVESVRDLGRPVELMCANAGHGLAAASSTTVSTRRSMSSAPTCWVPRNSSGISGTTCAAAVEAESSSPRPLPRMSRDRSRRSTSHRKPGCRASGGRFRSKRRARVCRSRSCCREQPTRPSSSVSKASIPAARTADGQRRGRRGVRI